MRRSEPARRRARPRWANGPLRTMHRANGPLITHRANGPRTDYHSCAADNGAPLTEGFVPWSEICCLRTHPKAGATACSSTRTTVSSIYLGSGGRSASKSARGKESSPCLSAYAEGNVWSDPCGRIRCGYQYLHFERLRGFISVCACAIVSCGVTPRFRQNLRFCAAVVFLLWCRFFGKFALLRSCFPCGMPIFRQICAFAQLFSCCGPC